MAQGALAALDGKLDGGDVSKDADSKAAELSSDEDLA